MEAGLSVVNTQGTLQVDSNFKNLAYYDYFDVTVSRNIMSAFYQEFITIDPSFIHGYRCLTADTLAGVSTSGSQAMVVAGKLNTVVRIYRFRRDGSGNRLNFGLEVFNSSGALSFSSAINYMRVLGYFPFGSLTHGAAYSYPKRPAIICGTLGFKSYLRPIVGMPESYRYFVKADAFKFNGNNLTFGQVADVEEYWDFYPSVAEYGSNGSNVIVIDSSQLP